MLALDGKVLALGVNSGPEMMLEDFENILGQMKTDGWLNEQTSNLLNVLNCLWTL